MEAGSLLKIGTEQLLHELFERQAESEPGNIALVCGGKKMTYAELEQRANQLARFLRANAVGKGSVVGLLLPRSADVYVALLAILKAGAAYVPLDPDYPAERLAYILSDCGACALVTTSSLALQCGTLAAKLVRLDTQADEILAQSEQKLLPSETTWADPCYIIYTSGSTGRPKGVVVEHRSVCNLVQAEAGIFRVRQTDRVYQGFSIAFDASVEEIWLAFFAGATLVVGTQKMTQAGPALSRLLTAAGVTVLSCVPTLLAMLEEDIPTVRLLILGGEECPQKLVERWCKPGRRMVNTYGPTEATVIATYAECAPTKPVTIGRPLPNYQVFILDEQMQSVPAAVTGEIHIGGVGLAREYVGQPSLSREKFVNHEMGKGNGPVRLYKTGDLGRLTPDGEIEFMGRADSQVKLRGFRVELSEIESVLLESPGVVAAAVTVREDIPGIQQLIGYIILRDNVSWDQEALRSLLRSRLPAYMIPAIFERIAKLPTLPSGKVNRKECRVVFKAGIFCS